MKPVPNYKLSCVAKLYSRGKINLPAPLKADLDIDDGDQVIFIKQGNSWLVTTRNAWIRDAQAYAKSLNPENDSLVEALINERRAAANKEGL
jgi:bifunctional DNA-binding transcriptional regulator/antitoxin component of YhaV-PrlF toxin-antitoxin module